MRLRLNCRPPVLIAALALLSACAVRKADLDDDTGSTSTTDTSGPGTSEASSTGALDSSTGAPDSSTGGPDSSTGGAIQHASCDAPFPAPAPALPPINLGPDDRPRFDDWTGLDCEALTASPCGQPDDPPCSGLCLRGVEGGRGVCTSSDIDIWCDGEGEAIGYGEGSCWACSPIEARALACCQFPDGFDCRAWPYPSDGPPDSICARHEDCEPGLVCGPHRGSGYGICQCPGSDSEAIAPPETCFQP